MVKMNFLLQVSNLTGIESSSICLYDSVIWIYYMNCFVSCFITFLLIGSNLVFHLIGIVVITMTLVFSLLLILFLLEIELISFRVFTETTVRSRSVYILPIADVSSHWDILGNV